MSSNTRDIRCKMTRWRSSTRSLWIFSWKRERDGGYNQSSPICLEPFKGRSRIMSKAATAFEEWWVGSYYRRFVEREGVPLYEGSILEDLATLPLKDWERRGGKAAYTRLGNQEDVNLQIVEISPKGELKPEHHMYESVMYVMKGKGATTIWQEGEPKRTIEWEEGALLAIPLNAWHQEFNASSDEPCRLLFGSNLPHVINFYHNIDFVFNNSYVFKDRYSYDTKNYFTGNGRKWKPKVFETNFIPSVHR